MSAKFGFAAGLAVGVLAGSRAGRGLYDRSAAAASAVVHDPRVRSGASTALHRAGSAGSTVAGAAARKVTGRGKKTGAEGEDAGRGDGTSVEGDGERRIEGGARARIRAGKVGRAGTGAGRVDVDEVGDAAAGESRVEHRIRMKRLMGGVRGHRREGGGTNGQKYVFVRHSHHPGHLNNGVSAPSVQAKPKAGDETD